jgi:phage antirepressor YoqD-like protein
MTRATEMAHHQAPNNMPTWLRHVDWEDGYRESSKARTDWRRLVLFQPKVGEKGFSILTRSYTKSKQVAAE